VHGLSPGANKDGRDSIKKKGQAVFDRLALGNQESGIRSQESDVAAATPES
jgi:hypothetical protein